MSFDLQADYTLDWSAESQMVEGGTNKFNNCVPTAFQIALLPLGFGDIAPQTWTDQEYSPTYHGGEDFAHAIDFAHKHFANLPDIRVSNPRDTVAAIDAAGQAGFPTVLQAHCDQDAAFVDHYTGFFHMGIPVAFDGTNVSVRNVYWGKLHVLPVDFVRKMAADPAGWMAVFARSIKPIPPTPIDPCADVKAQLAAANANVGAGAAQLARWEAWYAARPR